MGVLRNRSTQRYKKYKDLGMLNLTNKLRKGNLRIHFFSRLWNWMKALRRYQNKTRGPPFLKGSYHTVEEARNERSLHCPGFFEVEGLLSICLSSYF